MAVSMRDLDPSFQGAGQKDGIEIWRIEKLSPVPVPKSSHGKFYTGDSYIILKTSASKSGALRHDIHYWLGEDTSQDEAGAAAIKTVELDAALGGRAVQYREVQGHETEKFLSYFKPCIIPLKGGIASGFKHVEEEEYKTCLYVCQGKHVVHVKEVPFARSSLNHDDIFILDTKSKIFQFNGSNSSIQERAKALEVVQYIKDTYHDGKCEVAAIGKAEPVEIESLARELLDTNGCYIVDCGVEVFVWMGRNTSLDERKAASGAADELLLGLDRPKCHVVRVIEGFETVMFRSKFDSWPQSTNVAVTEDGRGKVAALLKRQGLNVRGLMKAAPPKEEPQPYIDCTGNLQVWRVNGQQKTLLQTSDQSKFYSGDCYIFQYSYPGEDKEEHLIGTWFGRQSVEEDRVSAISQAGKIIELLKFSATQARIYEGYEPLQFFVIFQSFIVYKGGLSEGYKKHLVEKELADDTYKEDGVALFRVQGTGPDNMQSIQVEPVASSLNSSYCYILHSGSSVFTWTGNLTTSEDQELVERQLDLIKPDMQSKLQKKGQNLSNSGKYWVENLNILARRLDGMLRVILICFRASSQKVTEIYNFNQDDLMTEDIFILDCHSDIYIWVGQQVEYKNKMQALPIGEKFLEYDFLMEKLSHQAPIYIVMEGSEPPFFTRHFSWDSTKSAMHGNSFQRKLTLMKNGAPPSDKPKRRTPVSYGGRSAAPEKSQRSRSVSFSPDRVRVRGRSPAFNALAATFENPNARNLSTPPPMVRKLYPKSVTPDSAKLAPRSAAIAALTASFDKAVPAKEVIIPRSIKGSPEAPKLSTEALKSSPQSNSKEDSVNNVTEEAPKPKPETIQEDVKEGETEDEEGLPIYPYDRLKTTAADPVTEIDVTKRETYLSPGEFREKLGMSKEAFYKLPKWKQNKLKMALQLF
ncbi:unnamed protein product [Withania somnifera]